MYILYGGDPTRGLMVEMVMAEGAIPYELRKIDIRRGEHRSPDFLKVNPAGWVPALITPEGETVYETPAINLFLCERHALDLVPPPGDPDRGAFLSAFCNVTGEIEPVMKRIFYPQRYAPPGATAEGARDLAHQALTERLAPIDQRLAASGPFFLGARFSLADLTLGYWMPHAIAAGLLDPFPSIRAAYEAVRARPALTPGFHQISKRLGV